MSPAFPDKERTYVGVISQCYHYFFLPRPPTPGIRRYGGGSFSVACGGRTAAGHGDLSQHLDKNNEREMTKLRTRRQIKEGTIDLQVPAQKIAEKKL